jgi:hypothetical protein
MRELLQQIASAVTISLDQACEALQMVSDFLTAKLPPQITAQIDAVLRGDVPADAPPE